MNSSFNEIYLLLTSVSYLLSGENGSERGRGRDRTVGNRLSMAADFFHLGRTASKEPEPRTPDSQKAKLTWNPFRRTEKSRERDKSKRSTDDCNPRSTMIR